MEKDSQSWFHQQSSARHFMGSPINTAPLNTTHAYMNPYSIKDSTAGAFPLFPQQQLKESQLTDSTDWLYCLSRFGQAFSPVPTSLPREKISAGPLENLEQKGHPEIGTAHIPKKFLVFDQSGDKTTLLFSSGAKTQAWQPKPPATHNLIKEEARDMTSPLGPNFKDECIEYNYENDSESEMHEDTEELNALLCSDSESDCSEDDDETSTGHSPSTMTDNGIHEIVDERSDRGSNSIGSAKRQKLLDVNYHVPSLVHSSTYLTIHMCSDLEDDAQSSCGNENNRESNKLCSLSGSKRPRKESILETVSILQGIIPGGKGKNAIVVIDEALDYLRSLKVKAKDLGLDTL